MKSRGNIDEIVTTDRNKTRMYMNFIRNVTVKEFQQNAKNWDKGIFRKINTATGPAKCFNEKSSSKEWHMERDRYFVLVENPAMEIYSFASGIYT